MKKQNVKEVLLPAVALLLICLIASLLLASTNAITKEKILEAQLAQKETNKKLIFSAAASFSDENSVTIAETKVVEYSAALNENREPIGYVFTCSAKGYGGPVSVMTGIDPSGFRSIGSAGYAGDCAAASAGFCPGKRRALAGKEV